MNGILYGALMAIPAICVIILIDRSFHKASSAPLARTPNELENFPSKPRIYPDVLGPRYRPSNN